MYRDSFCYHSTLGVVTLLKQKKLIMAVLVLTTGLKSGTNCEHTPQSSWNEGIDSFLLLHDLPNAMWKIESM